MSNKLTRRQVYNIIYNEMMLRQSITFLNQHPDTTEREMEIATDKFSRKASIEAVKNTERLFLNNDAISEFCIFPTLYSKDIADTLGEKK